MKFCLRILLLVFLVSGTLTQEFDLSDAFNEEPPTPAKPKQAPTKKPTQQGDTGFDLGDALKPDVPKPEKPKKPNSGDSGDTGFDLGDALKPDPNAEPDKPAVKPPSGGGGGGNFDDSDLFGASEGDYKPDGGRSGGRAMDPQGGADQPQETGSGPIAGIISAVGVALVGAASSYFAYQKKKLCFKLQGGADPGADPERGKGHQGTESDPQTFSRLLQTS